MLARIFLQRHAGNHLIEHLVEAAGVHELGHVEHRLLLAHPFQRGFEARLQFGFAQLAVAHLHQRAAARPAAARQIGDVAKRKGDGDDDEEQQRDDFTDGGKQDAANEGKHGYPIEYWFAPL